jgi:hypothetical protein
MILGVKARPSRLGPSGRRVDYGRGLFSGSQSSTATSGDLIRDRALSVSRPPSADHHPVPRRQAPEVLMRLSRETAE